MTTEGERSTVVFLGPSLPLGAAREILGAEYLPPARFGDVYRLIGGETRIIVLIDGVFHGHAPVWQREIGYALESGVRVYGASSMGALRAAELHAHGMIGVGTVFQWYLTGQIDGDDEVALLHSGPDQGYRPISTPLVTIRFNVLEAAARGIVAPEQAAALIAAMKRMSFRERSLDALWETPAGRSLNEPRRAALRAFFQQDAIDVKGRDAVRALQKASRGRDELRAAETPTRAIGAGSESAARVFTGGYYDRFRLLKRTLARGRHERVDGQALVDRMFSDPLQRKLLQRWLGAQFFVREWMRENQIRVPPADLADMQSAFRENASPPSLGAWLCDNGLTELEHRELLSRHLQWKWLLSRAPDEFGLSPALQDEGLLPAFPDLGFPQSVCDRASLARALPYVGAWCRMVGAAPGIRATRALTERWGEALLAIAKRHGAALCEPFIQAIWALEKGPIYFGHTTWSPSTELICAIQISGAAARLAAEWETNTP
jgi:hypothetical protein